MSDQLSPGEQKEQEYRNSGFSEDEIADWKSKKIQEYQDSGFTSNEINAHFGMNKEPDMSAIKSFFENNLKTYNETMSKLPKVDPTGFDAGKEVANSFMGNIEAGWQSSVAGLRVRDKAPDMASPENPDLTQAVASGVGQGAGDASTMVGGGILGRQIGMWAGGALGTLSAPLTGPVGPVAGALIGGTVGAGIGSWAAPYMIRKILMDHYEKGDIKSPGEFLDRSMGVLHEAMKGGAIGAATSIAGPIAGKLAIPLGTVAAGKMGEAVAGPAAKFAAEVATMTTLGKAMEGKLPRFEDFFHGAVILGAFHGAGMATEGVVKGTPLAQSWLMTKLRNIYANTGEAPQEVVTAAAHDVILNQKLLSDDPNQPIQASTPQGEPGSHLVNPELLSAKEKAQLQDEYDNGIERSMDFSDNPELLRKHVANLEYQVKTLKEDGQHNMLAQFEPDLAKAKADLAEMESRHVDMTWDADKKAWVGEQPSEATTPPETAAEGEKERPAQPAPATDLSVRPPFETPEQAKVRRSAMPRTPEEAEVLSHVVEPKEPDARSPKERVMDWFHDMYANNFDYSANLKRAIAQIKLLDPTKVLTAKENAWVQTRLFAGHWDKVAAFFNENTRDASGTVNGESLNNIYREVPGDDQLGFDAYSMSKRGIEINDRLNRKGEAVIPWKDFNREGAEKVVEAGRDKYEELHQRRVAFQNRVLLYGYEKGLFTKDSYDRMVAAGTDYLPLHKLQDPDMFTGRTGGARAIAKRFFGAEAEVLDPRASVYHNTEMILRKADVNDIRNKMISNTNITDENGDVQNDLLRQVPKQMLPTHISSEELAAHLKKDGLEIEPKDLDIWRPSSSYLAENQMQVLVDGKPKVYEGDPGVIATLRKLEGDYQSAAVITKILGAANKSLRVGTTADPGFALRHIEREHMLSGVYSQTGQVPYYHVMKALSEFMDGKSDMVKDFYYHGGAVTTWDEMQKNYITNNLEAADKQYPFRKFAWNVIDNPISIFHASEMMIMASSNLIRFTEYKRMIERGATPDEAAIAAREVTPDQQKLGLNRSVFKTGVAFLGAHVNNMARMVQAFNENPQATLARLSVISGMSMMNWWANKDDKELKTLPAYQHDLGWNFHIPYLGHNLPADEDGNVNRVSYVLRLPKPWSPGILFGSGVERVLDRAYNKDPDAFKDFGHSLLESVVPNLEFTAVTPVLDQMENKNRFTDQQLVNQQHQKMLPEMQIQPFTSETAKRIAQLIGYVPYVRDFGPSADPLASPAVVENYIKGLTGTIGSSLLKLGDKYIAEERRVEGNWVRVDGHLVRKDQSHELAEPAETSLCEAPFFNEFCSRFPSMRNQDVINFDHDVDETTKVFNTYKAKAEAGDVDAMERIYKDNNMDLLPNLQGISKAIGVLRHNINTIQKDPDATPVDKRQNMDTTLFQIASLAKMGRKMMDDFHKAVEEKGKTKKAGGE